MLFKNHKSYCSENAAQIVCTENKKTYKAINKNSHIVFQYKIVVMLFLPQIAEKGATIC